MRLDCGEDVFSMCAMRACVCEEEKKTGGIGLEWEEEKEMSLEGKKAQYVALRAFILLLSFFLYSSFVFFSSSRECTK